MSSLSGATVRMQVSRIAWLRYGCMLNVHIDPVMAEYITIMIINNKTAGMSTHCMRKALIVDSAVAQIASELEDCAFSCFIQLQAFTDVLNSDWLRFRYVEAMRLSVLSLILRRSQFR